MKERQHRAILSLCAQGRRQKVLQMRGPGNKGRGAWNVTSGAIKKPGLRTLVREMSWHKESQASIGADKRECQTVRSRRAIVNRVKRRTLTNRKTKTSAWNCVTLLSTLKVVLLCRKLELKSQHARFLPQPWFLGDL